MGPRAPSGFSNYKRIRKMLGAVEIEMIGKPIRLALSMRCSQRHSPIGTNGTSVKPRWAVQLMQSHISS
jgi:hypothetical protein